MNENEQEIEDGQVPESEEVEENAVLENGNEITEEGTLEDNGDSSRSKEMTERWGTTGERRDTITSIGEAGELRTTIAAQLESARRASVVTIKSLNGRAIYINPKVLNNSKAVNILWLYLLQRTSFCFKLSHIRPIRGADVSNNEL